MNQLTNPCRAVFPEDVSRRYGATLCLGFAYIKSTTPSKALWTYLADLMLRNPRPGACLSVVLSGYLLLCLSFVPLYLSRYVVSRVCLPVCPSYLLSLFSCYHIPQMVN